MSYTVSVDRVNATMDFFDEAGLAPGLATAIAVMLICTDEEFETMKRPGGAYSLQDSINARLIADGVEMDK